MEENFNPKVSIIIPVYNGENFIRDAINSSINQTYKNIEIIVVNDGSTDDTENIVLSYGNKVRYLKKNNGGVSSALNLGISKMQGEYFSWLSHDDLYKPDKIKKEIEALQLLDNKETIISCNVNLVDSSLKLIKSNDIPKAAKESIKCFLAFDNRIGLNGCSLLIHRNLFNKYGLFNEKLRIVQDYDMWTRFLEKEEFYFLEDHLVLSRVHGKQVGQTSNKVIDEVDKLHSSIIKSISEEELRNYTNNSIKECINLYNQYKKGNYKKCAIEILVLYINILLNNKYKDEALKFLNEYIFKNNTNIELNKSFFTKNDDRKIKILFHNSVWIKGGVERVLNTLFGEFSKEYNVSFVTNDTLNGYEISDKINKIIVNKDANSNIPIIIGLICRLKNINLFIGNSNLDEFFLPTYKLLNELGIKSIAYNHYNYFLADTETWLTTISKIRMPYYKYADKVMWTTNESYRAYSKYNKNGMYIPNPNSYDVIKEKSEFSNNILCIGRFNEPKKRLDLTLKCFKKVVQLVPNAHLTVVGPYDLDLKIENCSIKKLLKKLNFLTDKVTFVGESSVPSKYYENSDILILTSETEGFGMVLTEAACYGVPSICFKISGIDDIIKDNYNGFLINGFNVDDMASKIIEYLNNKNKKIELSKNSIEFIKRFSINNIIKEWNRVIQETLNNENRIVIISEEESQIIQKYENKLIDKGSILNQLKYYLETFGAKKTLKKILYKFKILK